ncbi:hypothetical protein FRC11_013764, partial [Ceratobasidium sp. 423]
PETESKSKSKETALSNTATSGSMIAKVEEQTQVADNPGEHHQRTVSKVGADNRMQVDKDEPEDERQETLKESWAKEAVKQAKRVKKRHSGPKDLHIIDSTPKAHIEPIPQPEPAEFSYKKALQDAQVTLDDQAWQAFVKLKMALTTDLILKPLVYNSRPFILMTDRSKAGFGAVLLQVWEEMDSKGNTQKG